MTIAEKLLQIAKDMPRVYNAGYADGLENGRAEGGSAPIYTGETEVI